MNNTIKYLRQIADHMSKAADHLADAAHLQSMLHREPTPWRERLADDHGLDPCELADVEPMETIGDVWREPVEPTGERHPNIGAALDRCRDVLGWDPDTLSSVDACSAIAELMSLDELDCAEALEKRRVEMSPRRSSRSTVLTAIAKRRSELEAAGVQS